jgi:allantoinase
MTIMSDFDLLVRGSEQDIAIAHEKFVAIGTNLKGSAREEIDATNLSIFPGVIDSHLHFNEPGRTEWEGFSTGSRAAAAGGTTTVFDMPLNAHPPTIDGPSFAQKRVAAEKTSDVDFALWGGLVPGNLKELKTLRDRGVVGLKAFMCNSGIDDFPHVDDATLRDGMHSAAELDLLVAVHAESEEITQRLTREKKSAGKTAIGDYLESRPVEAELDAIGRAIRFAHETGCRLHIVHVSCGSGVQLVTAAREKGIDVTCETCPHYLLLTKADLPNIGPTAKCAPPLRSIDEQNDLWRRLVDVTTIGSDHSPSPFEMKKRANFFEVWGGISGCQHLLPLLVDAAQQSQRSLSQEQIANLTSRNVAKRFGLAGKGGIEIGKDADLTLVDTAASDLVAPESLHYRHRHSPYVGRKLSNRIVRTILRGRTIFERGKFATKPEGRFVRPDRV